MKYLKLLLIVIPLLFFFSCKKDSGALTSGNADGLSEEDASFLEAIPDTVIHMADVILDNGQSVSAYLQANDLDFYNAHNVNNAPVTIKHGSTATLGQSSSPVVLGVSIDPIEQKRMFTARMALVGNLLVTRSYWKGLTGQENGLAYVSGQKNLGSSSPPHKVLGDEGCLDKSFYGLDCSGMMYQETTQSGMGEIVPQGSFNVINITDTSKWNTAFASPGSPFPNLKMNDLGKVPISQLEVGDVIFWTGDHVGIYLAGGIYESAGHRVSPGCEDNASTMNGPKGISLYTPGLFTTFNGGRYKVFRVSTRGLGAIEMVGFWNVYVPYDGTAPIALTINGKQYQKTENTLTFYLDGTLSFYDGYNKITHSGTYYVDESSLYGGLFLSITITSSISIWTKYSNGWRATSDGGYITKD